MRLLDKIQKARKGGGEGPDPFRAMNYVVERLVEPEGLAKYTLSDLKDGEIRSIAMLLAVDEMLRQHMGWQQPTILRSMTENLLILRASRRRRRLKEIISVMRAARGQAQTPIMMKPVKRIIYGEESEE
ncbi:hypothetical protein Pyrde_0085 [Pyrodictium delaneyi]|uniref:Uncharacterized protein n=1 Tax=Pyrodictium delaneyi TaxID=1273541 RepID=A0A0P0N2A5_9CREN|nr:hypothetical protein [Pyrodictium delaneyi]ALL00135.1 hypothetical protein Pyrde_0085 [Pyrodictium delaneyi]OWJ54225.1 hypothetical protein Pdsh_06965 [Pyrodictium delaneyi]